MSKQVKDLSSFSNREERWSESERGGESVRQLTIVTLVTLLPWKEMWENILYGRIYYLQHTFEGYTGFLYGCALLSGGFSSPLVPSLQVRYLSFPPKNHLFLAISRDPGGVINCTKISSSSISMIIMSCHHSLSHSS